MLHSLWHVHSSLHKETNTHQGLKQLQLDFHSLLSQIFSQYRPIISMLCLTRLKNSIVICLLSSWMSLCLSRFAYPDKCNALNYIICMSRVKFHMKTIISNSISSVVYCCAIGLSDGLLYICFVLITEPYRSVFITSQQLETFGLGLAVAFVLADNICICFLFPSLQLMRVSYHCCQRCSKYIFHSYE